MSFLRRQFLRDGDLPFTNVLTRESIARALTALGGRPDRIFTPPVTPRGDPGQALSADHSRRAAVARPIARRLARGQSPCSARAGACRRAGKRLPESSFAGVARRAGRAPDAGVGPRRLRKRRRVCPHDGPPVTTPDTPENPEYPRPVAQEPGPGSPPARIAAVSSPARGAALEPGICRHAGKGRSEPGMLRALWGLFPPGDVAVADRLTCAWTEMVVPHQRGVRCVFRFTSHRKADFRRGKRPGRGDHVVVRPKPAGPRSVDRETYDALPESSPARECRVRVGRPGFRVKALIVAATPPDAGEFTKEDPARLYRARRNAEPGLGSLRATPQMDVLRRKTPGLGRKELRTRVLAYGLIRTITAEAAAGRGVDPRSISFKGAVQALEASRPAIALPGEDDPELRRALYEALLAAIAGHRVGDRPDRYGPRRRKRRPKPYDRLTEPRHEAKRRMPNGFREKEVAFVRHAEALSGEVATP